MNSKYFNLNLDLLKTGYLKRYIENSNEWLCFISVSIDFKKKLDNVQSILKLDIYENSVYNFTNYSTFINFKDCIFSVVTKYVSFEVQLIESSLFFYFFGHTFINRKIKQMSVELLKRLLRLCVHQV